MKSKIYKTAILCIAICGMAWQGYAQQTPFKKADRCYEGEAYPTAVKLYLAGLKNQYDQRAAERLASCYKHIGQVEEATRWYEKAAPQTKSADVAYDYAQILKMGGQYKKAAAMFDKYGELSQRYEEARKQAEACERAEEIKGDGKGWKVNATDINTPASDFGPWIAGNRLVYASARHRGFFSRFVSLRNDNLFYDLYAAEIKGPVTFGKSKLLRGSLKTRYHDGPVAFTRDMQTVYFTRSNLKKGKLKRDQQNRSHLQLLSAQRIKGKKYKKEVLLPFNGDSYSSGHPALSADGETMVFASDIIGGEGGSDLYITKMEKGKWSVPRNLGSEVNTAGDELFPYLSANGMLFFASDGHPGLGGLDIFWGSPMPDGNWGSIKNPGSPLNSAGDDFSIVWDNRGQGYFASNRSGGKGDDDIYQFSRIIPLDVWVTDVVMGEPVSDVKIRMLSSTGAETVFMSDAKGKAASTIDWNKGYKFTLSKQGYRDAVVTMDFDPEKSAGGRSLNVALLKYPVAKVDGMVSSATDGKPVMGAKARVVGELREFPYVSDDKGRFVGTIDTASAYTAIVEKSGFQPSISEFTTDGMTHDATFPVWATLKPGGYVLVEGVTIDKTTGAKLAGTHLRALTATDSVVSGPIKSRKDGKFWLVIDRNSNADVLASRDGYFTTRVDMPDFTQLKVDSSALVSVELVPAKVGELVKIIYYDYRESALRMKSKNDLDEIVFFLLDNPAAVVELSAHTDARGTDVYNQTLSEARAKAAVEYVISKGVGKDRIQAKGYGKTQMTNDCGEGKECTDDQHAANRRTEIRIIAIQ
jgi:outer membrane protein OmpA-like peptidoglycan-associated protein/tetratricopeptide (TPR) repeat protein